ncbi:MAG: PAS-domain containing protein [bacterium]|nr:PAS-domain containing protein [bacterium]
MTERFSLLAGIASDWWWEMDADLRFTFLSERFTEIFGLPASVAVGKRREEIGRTDYDNPAGQAHLEDLAKRRPFRNFETTFVDVNGVPLPVMISGTPIFRPDGAFKGYIGVGHDLTELRRKDNEAAARATNLESILRSIDQGVVLLDADLRIVDYNPRLVEFLHLDANRIYRGELYEDITRELARRGEYAPEDEEAAVALRLRMVRSRERVQKERKRPDGRIVSVTFNPLPPGGGVMTYSDVTDARARQERQRESTEQIDQERAKLVTAQAVAKVGSWETDLASLTVVWSAETFRVFEVDPSTFSPTHEGFLARVHPDDRDAVDEAFKHSYATREICTIEHRVVTPAGRLKFVTERWQTSAGDDGKPLRAIGTCQDITELKLAQQKAD